MASASGFAVSNLSTQLQQADQQIEQTLTVVRQTGNLATLPASLDPIRVKLESLHEQLIASGQSADASFAILRAGDCLRIVDRWHEALDHYRQAAEEGRAARRVDVQAKAWLGTERAERLGLHDYGAAGEAIRQANDLLRNEPALWPVQADVWGEQSDLELAQGVPLSALQTLGKVISLCTEHHDDSRLWITLLGRASVYHDLADADRARFLALPIDSAQAWKANEEAAAKVRRQLQQAIEDTEQGIVVSGRAGATGMGQMFSPQVALRQQLAQQFEKMYASKRATRELVVRQQGDGTKRREPMMVEANGQLIAADLLEPALPVGDKTQRQQLATAMLQAVRDETRPSSYTWRRRLIEGQLQEAEGHIAEALESYREGARVVGKERSTLKDERLRATFVTEKMQLYDRLILNLLQLKEYDEAFAWMEQSRSRAMLDMLATLQVNFPQPAERTLYADLVAARSRAASAQSPEEESAAEREQEAVLARIRQQAPKLLELVESNPVQLGEMQRELSRTPCDLVYYILHAGRIVLWHIGPTRIDVRAYYASASQVQGLANDVVTSAAGYGAFDTQAAADLYTYLAKPALQFMETKRLVIVPPPELGGLPFQALFDTNKQQFFGEQVALSYGPSASTIARLAPARSLHAGRVLVAVGPDLTTEGSEAEVIAQQYPHSKILRGAEATLPRMAEESTGKTAIHIAAHGEYQDADPMLSFLRLSDGSGGTHPASAAEMLSLPLQGVAAVTLASCNTGKAKITSSGETYGFLRSLLYAGAQSVVLPLWEVSDEGAAFWFESFYSNAQSQDLPEAARLAIIAARRHPAYGAHPRFWAAYQVFGH